MAYQLGLDRSGNNNNFVVTNMGITDQVLDSPTNNFATLNNITGSQYQNVAYSEGNLKSSGTEQATYSNGVATMAITVGQKRLYEVCYVKGSFEIGILALEEIEGGAMYSSDDQLSSYTYGYSTVVNSSNSSAGDVYAVEVDASAGRIYYFKNDSAVSNNAINITNVTKYLPAASLSTSGDDVSIWNFGQDSSFAATKTAQGNQDGNGIGDFFYAPTAGYLAVCTNNLPEPTVDPSNHFNTVIWTGNATDDRDITGVGFQPDFSWIKSRATTNDHLLFDSVRGAGKYLRSNSNDGETSNADTLQAFISDGLEIGADSRLNANNDPVVAMNWKASTAFSNDTSATSVGSIDSAGKVNTAAGFSIIQYVGEDEQDTTVAHGLSKAPEMIWIKASSEDGRHWRVFFGDNTDYIRLNEPTARTDDVNYWNDTSPTSTVFSIGDANDVNDSGCTFISYNFHSVEGYSKVGLYTGNNNVDGTYTYTGFRPAFVIYKRLTNGADWHMYDNKRDPINEADLTLFPNGNNAESAGDDLDFLSNGFKQRSTGAEANANGDSYVYMAFAKTPFKYANAR